MLRKLKITTEEVNRRSWEGILSILKKIEGTYNVL